MHKDFKTGLITVQTSFSSRAIVPSTFRNKEGETEKESNLRKSRNLARDPESTYPNCSPKKILGDLKEIDWVLVSTFFQKRINPKNPNTHYYMARGIFYKKDVAHLSSRFLKVQRYVESDFQILLERAIWRLRVFQNPLFKEGKSVPGFCSLSIDLDGRRQLETLDNKLYYMSNEGAGVFEWDNIRIGNGKDVTVYLEK